MESVEFTDRFRIANGDIIVALGLPNDTLLGKIRRASRPQLVVNGSLGFHGTLDFLREIGPLLTSLEVVGTFPDDSAVSACINLIELNLNTDCTNEIEWSGLPNLRYLFTYADRLAEAASGLARLEYLHLYGATDRHLSFLDNLPSLREIRLSSAKISRLPTTRPWPMLRSLDIGRAPSLRDFSGVSRMADLESLTLEQCRHLQDLTFLGPCRALRYLNISDSGKVASLTPIQACTNLEQLLFYGSTDIVDGDLSVLARLPHLEHASFQKRRHYRKIPPGFPSED